MARIRKLSKASAPRKALIRNQVTALIWCGRIETTITRAKVIRPEAEKLIAKAIRVYDKNVTVTKSVKDGDNTVEKEFVNDSPEKLAVRRQLMAELYDLPLQKGEKETKFNYKKRENENKHPVVEKLFREIAPKYAEKAKEQGVGGGYTRMLKLGARRGDATEKVIVELV